ncbi:DUF6477 family protein [Roseobacteraceae bacterium S113]
MKDIIAMLQDLRRPRLLIQAARIGSHQYERDVHLPRLLGYGAKAKGAEALMHLIEMEQGVDEQRRENNAAYSIAKHVDILAAMMGEAAILRVARAQPKLHAV